MKRISIGIAVFALLFLLFAAAFAFSITLQTLHVNAFSFEQPASSLMLAAPMTSADEAQIASPQADRVSADQVRFGETQQSTHVCPRDKATDQPADF